MSRLLALVLTGLLFLSACAPAGIDTGRASNGFRAYNLKAQSPQSVRLRMLDGINALRQSAGLPPLRLNDKLNRAAMLHSADMAAQQRPWHFGHDGSNPVMRVQRVGYDKELVGEDIGETYETELEILAAWMEDPVTREPIMSPQAEDMGLGWYQ
ncbi:MAG: CAP domain-containing protein, partial [Alphaproteobacteria bacterium]